MSCLLISASSLFSQERNALSSADTLSQNEFLKRVYTNLERKSEGYNDLKDIWLITDPALIREVFNQLVRHNAVYVDSERVEDFGKISKISKIIENNRIEIKCISRFFDDEIEFMQFINDDQKNLMASNAVLDPYRDWVTIRNMVGKEAYEKLKKKRYSYNSLKKDFYQTYTSYYFDLNFSAFDPDFMFWNTTSNATDKYLVSAFGKWGNNNIPKPGWYYSDYIAGLKVTYLDSLTNDKDDHAYSVALGGSFPVREITTDNRTLFKKRGITNSSSNIYFMLSGNPLLIFTKSWRYFHLSFEGYLNIADKNEFDYNFEETALFYSIKNYATVSLTQKNIADVFDFGNLYLGAGMSYHDIYRFLYIKDDELLQQFGTNKQYTIPFGEIGITKDGGLFQHSVIFQTSYNTQEKYGYWGLRAQLSMRNSIGIDIRYSAAFNRSRLPFWHQDSYLVVSPFIRINY